MRRLGIALAAVLFLGASPAPPAPSHGQPEASQGTSEAPSPKQEPSEPFWQRATTDPVAAFTLILAGFTGILTFATGLLWLETKAAITESRKSSEREIRAYVFPRGIDILNVCDSKLPAKQRTAAHLVNPKLGPFVQLGICNFGQTPAYQCVIHSFIDVFDVDPPPNLTLAFDYSTASHDTIGPDNVSQHARRMSRPLTALEIVGLKSGTKAIFFWGKIDYTDAFGEIRWSTFANYYNCRSGAVGIGTAMTSYRFGNDGDRDKKKPSFRVRFLKFFSRFSKKAIA